MLSIQLIIELEGMHSSHLEYLQPEEVDVICVSLDTAMASVGGFCAGKSYIIDHQRLSGLGYCFSASVPPMMAAAAIEALNVMESSSVMFTTLQEKIALLRQLLQKWVYTVLKQLRQILLL